MAKNKDYFNDTAIQAVIQMGTKLKKLTSRNEKLEEKLEETREILYNFGIDVYCLRWCSNIDEISTDIIADRDTLQKFVDKLQEVINEDEANEYDDDNDMIDDDYDCDCDNEDNDDEDNND